MDENKLTSKPITIRVPHDLLEEIDKRASALGNKRNRTEVMLNLMRKALDLPIPTISQSIEKTEKLDKRLSLLEKEVNDFKLLKKELEDLRDEISLVRQSQTKSDKKIEPVSEPLEPLQLKIKNDHEDTEISNYEVITSGELMKILREKAPDKTWKGSYLKIYREGKKAKEWHEFNGFKFRYKGIDTQNKKANKVHLWLVANG